MRIAEIPDAEIGLQWLNHETCGYSYLGNQLRRRSLIFGC